MNSKIAVIGKGNVGGALTRGLGRAGYTVFAEHMDTGQLNGTPLTALAASDDVAAKATVLDLARKIGFDAVDAGPLTNARWLEALGYLNIQLGYMQKMGTRIGFTLVR